MSTTDTFLNHEELEQLTGCQLPYMQRRELRKRKWVFEENARGEPIVLRAYMHYRLGLPKADAPKAKTKVNLEKV